MNMDSIAMASAISIDLGKLTLLASVSYKPYALGYLESCISCMHTSRLSTRLSTASISCIDMSNVAIKCSLFFVEGLNFGALVLSSF